MLHPSEIDQNTTLCLACSCSLPPLKKSPSHPSTSSAAPQIFLTSCCHRPICPGCIAANPRLQRYDPCLACLGGVGVVRSGSGALAQRAREKDPSVNIDGAVRDEDMFVLGDDEEDDAVLLEPRETSILEQPEHHTAMPIQEGPGDLDRVLDDSDENLNTNAVPSKYFITRNDTLQGIALRYGLNGHELCRLNNLPPSTLRTTPHLLHTRQYLTLPRSARHPSGLPPNENADKVREREARIQRERAERRLQTLTKEVDLHIAKAYVALADDEEEMDEYDRKRKEGGLPANARLNLEERAIGKYLDDEEWEANVSNGRGKVGVTGLPFAGGWGNRNDSTVPNEVHGSHW